MRKGWRGILFWSYCIFKCMFRIIETEKLCADEAPGRNLFSVRRNTSVCACLVIQLCPTLSNSVDCSPPGPLSMEFPRQEHWSGLPFPPLGDLPDPRIEPESSVSCIDRQILYHWATWEAPGTCSLINKWLNTKSFSFYCLMCIFLRVLKGFDRCQSDCIWAHFPHWLRAGGTYSEFHSE